MAKTDELYERFPLWLRRPVTACEGSNAFTEIRLKANRGVLCYSPCGCISLDELSGENGPSERMLRELLQLLSGYSLNVRVNELKNGFLTLDGGHRVGVCAAATQSGLHSVSSLNIRIAREVRHCASLLYERLLQRKSILVAGPVASGKTTLLRDMARRVASAPEYFRTVIVDERRELASVCGGVPQFDVGDGCDVLDGVEKYIGCAMAVRSLSPDYIVFDEIGGQRDIDALEHAKSCGCEILASLHTEKKPTGRIAELFDSIAYLGKGAETGRIIKITDKEN